MKLMPIFLALLLAGCATTLPHEPVGEHDTLVVGEVFLHGENFQRFGSATVNGDHSAGILVTVREVYSGKETQVFSVGKSGLFSFPATPGVEYRITRFDYTNQAGGYFARLIGDPDRLRFKVEGEGVFSLGAIVWSADDRRRYYARTSTDPSRDVKTDLLSQYPKTKWADYSWASVTWLNQ